MGKIAITKPCTPAEKAWLDANLSPDHTLFYDGGWNAEEIDIVLGEPDLAEMQKMPRLRWVQMTWAGANKYTCAPFPENVALTTASGAFGIIISEHILAGILTLYKNLPAYRRQMAEGDWALLPGDDTLEGKQALILGTGDIGTQTAKKLKAFGVDITGICRENTAVDSCFDRCFTVAHLDELLGQADLVIVALPGTNETTGLLGPEQFAKMKPNALFVNVGRGFVADTAALTQALETGKLRGAVLDVVDPEPLPQNHILRTLPNVVLTPHISGISWGENAYTRKRILNIFLENIRRDAKGLPLKNFVDFTKGY